MSAKESFERAWLAQFSSRPNDTPPPVPALSCWDSTTGNLRSLEALRNELDRCRQRITELKRELLAEEYVEFYCQQELNSQIGGRSRDSPKRSASAPHFTNNADVSEFSETAAQVECLYSEPADSMSLRNVYYNYDTPQTPEGLYSEPINAKCLGQIPSVPEAVYTTPVTPKPLTSVRRPQRHAYEEIDEVRSEIANAGDDSNSSEDESVANLVAIRQSLSRLSQWCVDGDVARKRLEMQAKHLSSRFSYVGPTTGSGLLCDSRLDSVPESLLSPTTPSGIV